MSRIRSLLQIASDHTSLALSVESITADVTPDKDKPLWPLSSYGPSKYEPVIISGLDESPEELHLKAVIALGAGTTDEYVRSPLWDSMYN